MYVHSRIHVLSYPYFFAAKLCICSVQSGNLRNLEIALRILGILRLRKLRVHTIVDTEDG